MKVCLRQRPDLSRYKTLFELRAGLALTNNCEVYANGQEENNPGNKVLRPWTKRLVRFLNPSSGGNG